MDGLESIQNDQTNKNLGSSSSSSTYSPQVERVREIFDGTRVALGKLLEKTRETLGLSAYEVEERTGVGRHLIRECEISKRSSSDFRTVFVLLYLYQIPFSTIDQILGLTAKEGPAHMDKDLWDANSFYEVLSEDEKDELLTGLYSKAFNHLIASGNKEKAEEAKQRFGEICKKRMGRILERSKNV